MPQSQPKVFVFSVADRTLEAYRPFLDAGCTVAYGEESWMIPGCVYEDDMAAIAADASALTGTSIRSAPITRRVMEGAQRLRIVAKCTIGVDDVDVDAATDLGILVTHAPTRSNWGGVAEGAMAMMLAMLKKSREKDRQVKGGGWRDEALLGTYLGRREEDGYPGITIGIVGLGRIGSRLAELLAPWDVRLIACDPYVEEAKFARYGAERVDLGTLYREADVVSVHVTLTRETRKMIGAAAFEAMKPTALFMNTSRGAVVDEPAMAAALEKGEIACAALDVFDDEPLAAGSPLLKLGDRVLLSPHMVSYNHGSGLKPGIEWATRSVLAALRGEVPDAVFNPEVVPRWRERFAGNALIG